MHLRKDLCADSLINVLKRQFDSISDHRKKQSPGDNNIKISLGDAIMSGFALFSQKNSSLLEFEQCRKDALLSKNMKNLYGIENLPSDTSMRELLDEVNPSELRPAFKNLFNKFQRGKCLDSFKFLDDRYLVALDGTGYFSSQNISCDNCLIKTSKNSGEVTFYHQMLGSVLIHPDEKVVLPLCPEPIIKQDGATKNDCERNAVSRWLKQFRKDHPKLKVIITEDGLSSNAPHIRDLLAFNCDFILGVKLGDHRFLFEQVHLLSKEVSKSSITNEGILHEFRFINNMSLNESNEDLKVNFLEYQETSKKGVKKFSWVTNITLNEDNIFDVMRGGRARWKIENETFNTLKNQGYNFGHNFGHGSKNLSVVFAFLMTLAFSVDQIQQFACKVFQQAREVTKTNKTLWHKIRCWFEVFEVPNWSSLFIAIAAKSSAGILNTS